MLKKIQGALLTLVAMILNLIVNPSVSLANENTGVSDNPNPAIAFLPLIIKLLILAVLVYIVYRLYKRSKNKHK